MKRKDLLIKFISKPISLEKSAWKAYSNSYTKLDKEDCRMKKHRFWAWAMIVCMFMAIYTGYEHQ